MFSENSYIKRVYRCNKFLFFIVLLVACINISVNFIIKGDLTPFFKWDLYAKPIPNQLVYSFLEVRYNDNQLLKFPHTWQEPEKLFFTNTMDLFIAIKRNNNKDPLINYYKWDWLPRHKHFKNVFPVAHMFNDTSEINQYPQWYKKYLSQYVNQPVDSIKIFEKKVEYVNDGSVRLISSNLLYTIL